MGNTHSLRKLRGEEKSNRFFAPCQANLIMPQPLETITPTPTLDAASMTPLPRSPSASSNDSAAEMMELQSHAEEAEVLPEVRADKSISAHKEALLYEVLHEDSNTLENLSHVLKTNRMAGDAVFLCLADQLKGDENFPPRWFVVSTYSSPWSPLPYTTPEIPKNRVVTGPLGPRRLFDLPKGFTWRVHKDEMTDYKQNPVKYAQDLIMQAAEVANPTWECRFTDVSHSPLAMTTASRSRTWLLWWTKNKDLPAPSRTSGDGTATTAMETADAAAPPAAGTRPAAPSTTAEETARE